MGCNDYNLHLDSSEGNESPTPEFKIYLDGVGVNGYSPTINFTPQTSDQFYITVNDINGTQVSPDGIPKMSYLTSTYVSNTSLASTLANYSTTAEIASAYLKVDGSNADNPITINNIKIEPMTLTSINSSLYLKSGNGAIGITPSLGYKAYYTPYNTSISDKYEIAVKDDISDATITFTQGGVTKGTFTLNGSATTINLDAGGGSITNPLEIISSNGNQSIFLGFEGNTSKVLFSEQLRMGGLSPVDIPLHIISSVSSPLSITKNNTSGLSTVSLNIDSDTLGVNSDNELYVLNPSVIYIEGTGIDITNNTISVDNTVAMKTDIPDTTYMVTTNTAQTISGVKTFSSETHHTGVITFDSAMLNPIIRGMSGSSYRNMIYRMGNDSAIIVGNSNDTIDLKGSGTRPTYNSGNLALYSDIPTNSTYVDLTSSQTITGKKAFSGAELETNNIITLKGNAIIRGLYNTNSYSTYLVGSSGSLLVGNESHGITLRGNTARPVYRTGGTDYNLALSDDIPTVPTTDQTYDNISTNPQSGTAVAEAISTKADTDLSNITSTGIETLLSTIYPVGAVYISTTATCPLASLMPNATWTKKAEDRVLQGSSSTHEEGTTIAAGLPEIYGNTNFTVNNTAPQYAFQNEQSAGGVCNPDDSGFTMTMAASRSSSIYGNSTTVQPPAYVVSIWERTA